MFIYSKKIMHFIQEIKKQIKTILSKEVGLKVHGDRFYDKKQRYSYPIRVVIFNDRSMLGYYDTHFYELGFHECLMHTTKEQLLNIIRHEIAHYMTCIEYGNAIQPHGNEFKTFCQRMGWGREVHSATTCLDDEIALPKEEENAILRKVQKLMALSSSSSKNESEQAMVKSQQLLLKHNINSRYITDEEKIILKRIMKQKRDNAKMRSIAKILKTFFVNTVYNRIEGFTYLEIIGNAINVEIAEYVASFLNHELDRLWKLAKKQSLLTGQTAKNSFLLGVAKGYCDKIQALKRQHDNNTSNALMIIEKMLEDAESMVYPRLTKSRSYSQHCANSAQLGEQAGSQLSINPALNNSAKNSGAYLVRI